MTTIVLDFFVNLINKTFVHNRHIYIAVAFHILQLISLRNSVLLKDKVRCKLAANLKVIIYKLIIFIFTLLKYFIIHLLFVSYGSIKNAINPNGIVLNQISPSIAHAGFVYFLRKKKYIYIYYIKK